MQRKELHPVWKTALDYLLMIVGTALYAFSFHYFFLTNKIAYGGITGIALIINTLFGAPSIGVLIVLLNIPLFLLGWRMIGRSFLIGTLFATLSSSVMIDLVGAFGPFPPMDPLLACIYGGLLTGLSLGLIFRLGASTGGIDIAARLLKERFGWLPLGRILFLLDGAIILAAALAFRNLNSALYALIAIFVSARFTDLVLYGLDTSQFAYIISSKPEAITEAIINGLQRGVTILNGWGGYSKEEKQVILCAFKRNQVTKLERLVKELDPDAFLIVSDAHEVLGDGFGPYRNHRL